MTLVEFREVILKEHDKYDIVLCENSYIIENCYMIKFKNKNEAIIIDPGIDINKLMTYLENNKIKVIAVLLTHGHFDHAYSTDLVRDTFNCPAYALSLEQEILLDSEKNMAKSFFKTMEVKNVKNLEDIANADCEFNINDFKIKYIHTPGHTIGSCSYLFDDVLFSGDTLFFRVYGRTDLYSGSMDDMKKSLKQLFLLDDNIKVYPGHRGETTIGFEKENNLILREYKKENEL